MACKAMLRSLFLTFVFLESIRNGNTTNGKERNTKGKQGKTEGKGEEGREYG